MVCKKCRAKFGIAYRYLTEIVEEAKFKKGLEGLRPKLLAVLREED